MKTTELKKKLMKGLMMQTIFLWASIPTNKLKFNAPDNGEKTPGTETYRIFSIYFFFNFTDHGKHNTGGDVEHSSKAFVFYQPKSIFIIIIEER